MSSLKSAAARLFGRFGAEIPGAPTAEFTFVPTTVEECAAMLDFASEHGLAVLPWGGGTHGLGPPTTPDVVIGTAGFGGIDWRPDDLTAVVGAGVTVSALEEHLGSKGQSAVLVEHPGTATVGGVVASGVSGWRRLRYGPTRDRVLEVVVATGDGRVIRGGGQVVKNVTGYDLPRLFTGSLGSLGVITRVCLKLWPRGSTTATVTVDDPERAAAIAVRPLAVLQTARESLVYLAGTAAEVAAQSATLGGLARDGLHWPERPRGEVVLVIRVPPARVADVLDRIAGDFVAAHSVGEVLFAGSPTVDAVAEWRSWTESIGGSVVITSGPAGFGLDPWGSPPPTVGLQRRIKAAFDPIRVMVPGRLPGGV